MQGYTRLPVTAACLCLAFAWAGGIRAQAQPAPASVTSATAPTATAGAATVAPLVPAGTAVDIEILEEVSSGTRQRGDVFPIRLAAPLLIDGVERVPADVRGVGQVVHAAHPRAGGGAGELLVTVRALHWNDRCIPLRGFSLGGSGRSEAALSAGVSTVIGAFGLLIRGKDLVIPAGTHGTAKLRYDFNDIPMTPAASAAPSSSDKETDPCAIA